MNTLIRDRDTVVAPPSWSVSASAMRDLSRNPMFVALVLVVGLFWLMTEGILLRPENLSNLVVQNGYILVLAIGMVMVIVGGHIDLSAGSVAGFVGAMAGIYAVRWELPWGLAILLALLTGALAGAWQGFWIAYVGVPSFIVTLAGMLTFRGLTLAVLGDSNVGSLPEGFRALGNGFIRWTKEGLDPFTLLLTAAVIVVVVTTLVRRRVLARNAGRATESIVWTSAKIGLSVGAIGYFGYALASYKGTPVVLIVLGILAAFYIVVTQRSVIGRQVYAMGGNRLAAQLSGVRVRHLDFLLFVNMGVLAALAGVIFTARLNLATPSAGTGFELEAISAAFVGGAAVMGGIGTVGGAIIGGLIIGILNNGMSILSLGVQWQQVVKGIVLLLAVSFGVWSKLRSGSLKR